MQLKNEHHTFTGMQRDCSIARQPSSFLYDAYNIRLTPREDDTLYSITNEKGTSPTDIALTGTYLGHCLLNKYLVVFTTSNTANHKDYIYRIDLDTVTSKELFNGNLNFSTSNPIKAIGSFENSNIQKVYWTDGINQPRVINIMSTKTFNDNSFDFTPNLKLKENVKVTRLLGSGEFPSGVIQYAFTYFNKYGQESNIFYVTPLYYISHFDRGGNPTEKIANAFKIGLTNLDTDNFEYLRIYSILRTSLNGTPKVKRIQDIKLQKDKIIVDEEPTINYSWYFKKSGAGLSQEVLISTNGGISYDSAESYKITDSNDKPLNGTREDITEWTSSIVNATNKTSYKFPIADLPNLIVNVGGYFYYYDEDVQSGYLYVGISDKYSGFHIVVGETPFGDTQNLYQTDKIISPETVGVTFVDDGTQGDEIDPTELLFKGGEVIKATTIAQKDNTLFLGGISIIREHPDIKDKLKSLTGVDESNPLIESDVVKTVMGHRPFILSSRLPIAYINTLGGPESELYMGASYFKSNEYYRLGVQFQHESGKWSEPYWIGDKRCTKTPLIDEGGNNPHYRTKGIGVMALPEFNFTLSNHEGILETLINAKYKRARPVFVVPLMKDRTRICQGVACPTLYRKVDRWMDAHDSGNGTWTGSAAGILYAQSSWIFRTNYPGSVSGQNGSYASNAGGIITSSGRLLSQFHEDHLGNSNLSPYLPSTEVMGYYDDGHSFYSDPNFITFHSPDIQFDDSFSNMDFSGCTLNKVGIVPLRNTYGDIDIQTSTPPIDNISEGFVHRAIITEGYAALISGLFYNDYIVDAKNSNPEYVPYSNSYPPLNWPVFMWHKNGSLNNDAQRAGRTAELLKKKISNYRYAGNTIFSTNEEISVHDIKLFNSDQVTMIKVDGLPYRGNIETMITPEQSPFYFAGNPFSHDRGGFGERAWFKLDGRINSGVYQFACHPDKQGCTWYRRNAASFKAEDDIKEEDKHYVGEYVYQLTRWREGVVIKYKSTPHLVAKLDSSCLSEAGALTLMEVVKPYNKNTIFGGTSEDAMHSATWIPCGPVVNLNNTSTITLEYKWGDCYFQRFECLKTYPFTTEDKNQVVEIASFIVESRINADGRYDRNRGQSSNLNMSPQNFNLLNPVYNQLDNFFSYRILDKDYYEINDFPNQIAWSKEKQTGADVDLFTNITLANTYNMDGSKGPIKSLNTWKDNIYCFQDKGISNILFNSRVQIPTSDNVPIEISNSYKVEGHRYISDGVGCNSPQLITDTPSGMYFIDSISNHLFNIGTDIADITATHNMSSWFSQNNSVIKKITYDDINHDIYIVGEDTALCFSELLGQFTSFMSYEDITLMESYDRKIFAMKDSKLYRLFNGEYNDFFGNLEGDTYIPKYKPWSFTFISNGADNSLMDFDKIFTNIDYRMDMKEEDSYKHNSTLDYIRVTTEYQDTGECNLKMFTKVNNTPKRYPLNDKNLQKKFREWRVQIPRNKNSLDRIRNPWCKVTLGSKNANNYRAILHDLNVQYYM